MDADMGEVMGRGWEEDVGARIWDGSEMAVGGCDGYGMG